MFGELEGYVAGSNNRKAKSVRISLLCFLTFVTGLTLVLGYFATSASKVISLKSKVETLGGAVVCRHEVLIEDGTEFIPDDAPLNATRDGLPEGWLAEPVAVHLSATKTNDVDLEDIIAATTLEGIALDETQITDKASTLLATLPNLREVGLSRTGITDTTLKRLSELPKLRSLDVSYTAITDVGLRHLHNAKTLTSINLAETSVTEEGLYELQTALPNCRINYH